MSRHDDHGAWRWIVVGQVWMFAAFTGMSLLVIAGLSALHGGAGHGPVALLTTACAGALLVLFSWQGVHWMLRRLEGEEPSGPGPGLRVSGRGTQSMRAPPARARMAAVTPSW